MSSATPAAGATRADRGTAGTADPAPGWHARPPEDVLRALDADVRGLSAAQARQRLAEHGPNRLPRTSGPSAWALLARQVDSPLMYALLASAAVAMAFGELEDGLVVLAVVVLNAVIGFAQELRAGRAIAALADLVAEPARVRRDGGWADLPAEVVVPGDVVALAAGDRVPADLRVLHGDALRTQESSLTGESEPVAKGAVAVAAQTALAERSSIAYAGTTVAAGSGRGVVVATGTDTELGRISALLEEVDELRTPLTRELDRVGRVITALIAVAAVGLTVAAVVRGFPAADAALAGISLAVAAVPEGLPAVVTIALAIGVQRMARRRAIVRHLQAVETLGSTTVVASDKTGTLTRNEMTVQSVWRRRRRRRRRGAARERALQRRRAGAGRLAGRPDRDRAARGRRPAGHRSGPRARPAPAARRDPVRRRPPPDGDRAPPPRRDDGPLRQGRARGAAAPLPPMRVARPSSQRVDELDRAR